MAENPLIRPVRRSPWAVRRPARATPRISAATTFDGRVGRANGRGAARSAAGRGRLPALMGRAIGLPPGRLVPAELTVEPTDAGDRWTRCFGRRRWATTCTPTAGGMVEWIGPGQRAHLLGLDLTVDLHGDTATIRLRGLRLGRLAVPAPRWLHVDATVVSRAGGLAFATIVPVGSRVLVAYEGWIR